MTEPDLRDGIRGALIGLAVGDALGTTLEFKAPGSFRPIDDLMGGGPFNLAPGQWTDDTSMALCLADSLLACGGLDAADQLRRYLRWWRDGYRSSTGRCFDIGNTVADALLRFLETGDAEAGSTDPLAAGNGSLMRLAPVPIFYCGSPLNAIDAAASMSRTTHGAAEAVDACRYFCGLLLGALVGDSKERLCEPLYHPTRGHWNDQELAPAVSAVAAGSYREKQPPAIRGTGYVVRSLEAALWAFWHSTDFRSGAIAAVNLGDDADTTGAIYGQLAGAYYGESAIPHPWFYRLYDGEGIRALADELFATGCRVVGTTAFAS
ncbi:MAG: ADP-ribosylglycohydrolase family protein [Pseudohaliea sp.]